MSNEEYFRKTLELMTNPLFSKSFFDFFKKTQEEGIEAAKRFWSVSPASALFPNAHEMYERMIDFYLILGFVPRVKYEEVVSENKNLQSENKFLRDTIKELQLKVFTEGGENIRKSWQDIVDKQFEMNKEIAQSFFELFRSIRLGGA